MKKIAAVLMVLFVSTASQAGFGDWFNRMFSTTPKDYGTWECLSCTIPKPGDPVSNVAIPDVSAFIQANNAEIHADEKVARWIPNSSITVCNAEYCLKVYYQAMSKWWLPRGPATDRGTREVKVPKNDVPTGHRPISISFTGPVPTPTTQWTITIAPLVPTTWVAPPPVAATRTYTVTAGPLVVVGQGGEFTPAFTDRLNKEFDPGSFESIQPSEGGTYVGGGAGGEGGGIQRSKF